MCYNNRMIKIEKIIPGGQALGTAEDGKKVFFWNALPGETVEEYQIIWKPLLLKFQILLVIV